MNLKAKLSAISGKLSPRLIAAPLAATSVALGTAVTSFATTPDPLPTVAITSDMLTPLVEGVVANIGVILPVGLGLFAIFLGIRIIPGLISRFVKM